MPFLRRSPPKRVGYAVGALTAAWIVSAAVLSINQLLLHGSGIGPGPVFGILSLAVQAAMIMLVVRGNPIGRILVAVFFALAVVPLPMVSRLFDEGSSFSAAYLVISLVLKGAATALLFTGDAKRWFETPGPERLPPAVPR